MSNADKNNLQEIKQSKETWITSISDEILVVYKCSNLGSCHFWNFPQIVVQLGGFQKPQVREGAGGWNSPAVTNLPAQPKGQ